MAEIKVYKSVAHDYFVLQKNNDIPFSFKKEDLKVLIEKLNELNEEISPLHRDIKIYCFNCDTMLEILDHGACYCKKCEKFYTENEIRINCGI